MSFKHLWMQSETYQPHTGGGMRKYFFRFIRLVPKIKHMMGWGLIKGVPDFFPISPHHLHLHILPNPITLPLKLSRGMNNVNI